MYAKLLVLLMLAGGLRVMTAGTTVPALDVCPPGYGWAPDIQDCVDCAVCDTMPETSICPDCKGVVLSAVSSDNRFGQPEIAEDVNIENFNPCPSGYEWHPVLSDCMSCTVCADMPDTYICDKCRSVSFQHGLIAGVSILALAVVCSLSAIAWCAWKRYNEATDEIRQPIQETDGPEEIADRETVV